MNSITKRRLRVEGLESRMLLAGDVAAAVDGGGCTPAIIGDANRTGSSTSLIWWKCFRKANTTPMR